MAGPRRAGDDRQPPHHGCGPDPDAARLGGAEADPDAFPADETGPDALLADETDLAREVEQVRSAWQGVLHDEVSAALRAAATPGAGRLEVRRSARDALAAIEDLGDPAEASGETTDLVPALHGLARAARTAVEVDAPDGLVVPAPAAAAILGAVAESVRNVERHAAGASARVRVSDGEQVTVQVVDDGPGFVVGTRRRPGGLGVSVDDRMAHAGGAARVVSAPGQGTTVTLTWPRPATPPDAAVHGQEVWRRGVRQEAHARCRARVEEVAVPFLRRLAEADAPLDDDVRAEARLAEQAVRDEMHLPEVLDAPTRARVRAARAGGCRVRVQSDSATGIPAAQVNAVVTVALSVQPAPRELTLSVYTRLSRETRELVLSSEAIEGVERSEHTRPSREEDEPARPPGDHVAAQTTVAVVAVPGDPARRDALHRAFADRIDAVVDVLTDDDDATWAEIRVVGC